MFNVLSLFDGIGAGLLALKRAGFKVNNYYASEVDPSAMTVALFNHPEIQHIGDVEKVSGYDFPNIDLLIGGSPCTNLSSMGNRKGLEGDESRLFYEYLRILKECKPKYFLLENVASMAQSERDIITALLEVQPIFINSALVSAQTRKRLYWTNIPNVQPPIDKNISFTDILEGGFTNQNKSHALLTNKLPLTESGLARFCFKSTGQLIFKEKYFAELDKQTKVDRFSNMSKLGLTKPCFDTRYRNGVFRNITITEAEALQTLPRDYTAGISMCNRFKAVGNSFTTDIIAHILKQIPNDTQR